MSVSINSSKNDRQLRPTADGTTSADATQEVPRVRSAPTITDGCQLSLCMIVRDSSRTLRACLESIKPWVDEMIVVDTGSEDETVSIARSMGAKVFQFPWCDDFSAARNESLRMASGDWIFWMDSDDTISPDCGRRLRVLARQSHSPSMLGFVIQVHCPGKASAAATDVTVVDHIKLFRNRPDLRFEGRIHEQILPSIRKAGGDVAWTGLFVTHSGSDQSPEGQRRKLERDLRILNLELRDRPGHTFTLFNLGMTYADMGDHHAAVAALEQSLDASLAGESHVRKIFALLAASHSCLGNEELALTYCEKGLADFPEDVELRFRKAMLLYRAHRLDEAEKVYLSILDCKPACYFASIDASLAGYKTRHNLAVLYSETGRPKQAAQQWRTLLAEKREYRDGWRGLICALRQQGRFQEAERIADQICSIPGLSSLAWQSKAEDALRLGDDAMACACFERAIVEDAADCDCVSAFCEFLFNQGQFARAKDYLQKLTVLRSNDAAVYHNLGTVCLLLGQAEESLNHFRRSLELRPAHRPTLDLLEQAQQTVTAPPLQGSGGPPQPQRTPA